MSEKLNIQPESKTSTPEVSISHESEANSNKEALEKNLKNVEQEHKNSASERLRNVESHAQSAEEIKHAAKESKPSGHPVLINKQLKDMAYSRTLVRARKHLSAPSRALSKVIHSKALDKPSEVIGKTVARPSAMMGGAFFALAGTSALLWTTKHYGYEYNYLAVGMLFVCGTAAGLAAEGLMKLAKRR